MTNLALGKTRRKRSASSEGCRPQPGTFRWAIAAPAWRGRQVDLSGLGEAAWAIRLLAALARLGDATHNALWRATSAHRAGFWRWLTEPRGRDAAFRALEALIASGAVKLAKPGEAGPESWSWMKAHYVLVETTKKVEAWP